MEKILKEEFIKKAVDTIARNEIYDLPSKMKNRLIFLYLFVQNLNEGTFTEKEINEKIKETLAKMPRVYIDYVKIRRALIDYGFLERTKNGAVYIFSKHSVAFKVFDEKVKETSIFEEIENYLKELEEKKEKFKGN